MGSIAEFLTVIGISIGPSLSSDFCSATGFFSSTLVFLPSSVVEVVAATTVMSVLTESNDSFLVFDDDDELD